MRKIFFNIIAGFAAITALTFQSCADGEMQEFIVPKPDGYGETAGANDYQPLKSYVSPNSDFVLGVGGVDVAEYSKDPVLRMLLNSNFMDITPGNAMKYSSIVNASGGMNFAPVEQFINEATDNGISIYGHALCWHNQQTRQYLEKLIAPTPGGAAELKYVNKTVGGDCEEELTTASIEVVNQAVPDVVVGFTEEGGGASGAADDRALKIENPTGVGANFKLALGIKLPEGTFFTSGKKYKVKFDMKASAESKGLYVQLRKSGAAMQQGQEPLIASLGSNVAVSTEWTTYEAELDLPEGATDKNGAAIDGQYYMMAFGFAKFKNTFYFDNISLSVEESVGGGEVVKTPEEKKEILIAELDRWIGGMMTACDGKVKVWDAVNEPIEDGWNPIKLKTTPDHVKNDPTINEFYWQDYLGENYVREVIRLARKHGGDDLKLFINDYNLENAQNGVTNKKCETLIKYINQWEADGVTKIDGIGTQMHIHYNMQEGTQKNLEKTIVDMFELLAATGKLIKISELDMGLKDGNTTIYWETTPISAETHQAMADFYKFIIEKYFEIIPVAQQYGITHWKPIDPLRGDGNAWKAGEPVGLWFNDRTRKTTYGGFAAGLAAGF